jgi:hypothetical protein
VIDTTFLVIVESRHLNRLSAEVPAERNEPYANCHSDNQLVTTLGGGSAGE